MTLQDKSRGQALQHEWFRLVPVSDSDCPGDGNKRKSRRPSAASAGRWRECGGSGVRVCSTDSDIRCAVPCSTGPGRRRLSGNGIVTESLARLPSRPVTGLGTVSLPGCPTVSGRSSRGRTRTQTQLEVQIPCNHCPSPRSTRTPVVITPSLIRVITRAIRVTGPGPGPSHPSKLISVIILT